ncbi:MAG: class I SAM-dependent methyltransferase [Chloroflexota bacterium]|nr:class I SAM-dependent methyltransferase [Chloroflexota bacterium]
MRAGTNRWTSREHALDYLARADAVPHRTEGESVLLDLVPVAARRVLDLGTGDGRLLALLKVDRLGLEAVAVDFSPAMLESARARFAADPTVEVVAHDLDSPLPDLGVFDAVVSSFAIHHLPHPRKRALYGEVFGLLTPGGVFCNLEHVASPTARLHGRFLRALGIEPGEEDPSNLLLDLETQLGWLREIGYEDVDCFWKWLELALLAGRKPG